MHLVHNPPHDLFSRTPYFTVTPCVNARLHAVSVNVVPGRHCFARMKYEHIRLVLYDTVVLRNAFVSLDVVVDAQRNVLRYHMHHIGRCRGRCGKCAARARS